MNNNYVTNENNGAYVDSGAPNVENTNTQVAASKPQSKLKKILGNKNTVTIICALIGVLVLWGSYKMKLNEAIQPIKVPYAKVTIQPKQVITADMIGYTTVAKTAIKGNAITDINKVLGYYSNVNTMIPKGSMFYTDALIEKKDLPDASLYDKPANETIYQLPIDMTTSYCNSIVPGNYIDLYVQTKSDDGKVIVGKLISNIKVLAVKDANGRNVFESSSESRIPAMMIFSLDEELNLLLRKAAFVKSVGGFRIELIPVPTSVSINNEADQIKTTVSSTYIKAYIEEKSTYIPEDIVVEDNDTTPTE